MEQEKRNDLRFKASVPVEMHIDGSDAPMRCATSDISLGGCYIENRYTLPLGAQLELRMDIGDTLLIFGQVVTSDPHVGNGIRFTKILPEDREELQRYLNSLAAQEPSESAPN
jgi:c-di-GMP-binding flagellar brake protein YcgR